MPKLRLGSNTGRPSDAPSSLHQSNFPRLLRLDLRRELESKKLGRIVRLDGPVRTKASSARRREFTGTPARPARTGLQR